MIKRRLYRDLEQSLKTFPVVGLIGSRQSGKTTLAKMISSSKKTKVLYLDLERPSDLAKLNEAEIFLERFEDRLIIIDEIQRKPELFPLIRVLVDHGTSKRERFFILGSASPSLVRQASESLAGRIVYHELAPFTLDEVHKKQMRRLWCRGGYPLSFLSDSDEQSQVWRETFIQTYLERDIPQLGLRVPAIQLRRFWEMVAHSHGQVWNASKIAGSMGVSAPAIRRYLDILKDTFIVRQLQPYHPNIKKRLVKAPKVYLRDSGLLHTLLRISDEEALLGTPYTGSSFEGWVIEQILAMIPSSWPLYFYRTSSGAEMDLVLLPPKKPPIGIEIKFSKSPSLSKSFRQAFSDLGCQYGYIVCPVKERFPLGKKVEALPVEELSYLKKVLIV